MRDKIRRALKEFIIARFMEGDASLSDDDSLFETQVIDSFGMLELLSFIEKNFGVVMNASEIMIDNFDSVNKMVKLIESKKK